MEIYSVCYFQNEPIILDILVFLDKHNSETDDGKAAAVKELLTTDQSKNNLKISEREQKIASVNDVHVDDLRSTLLSALHIWDVIWLVCQRFRSWSYVGMLNPTLTRLAHNDKSVGQFKHRPLSSWAVRLYKRHKTGRQHQYH